MSASTKTDTVRALAVERDAFLPSVTARIAVPRLTPEFSGGGFNASDKDGTSVRGILVSAPDTKGLRDIAAAIVAAADEFDRGE